MKSTNLKQSEKDKDDSFSKELISLARKFKPQKKLGQHFLIDKKALKAIVDSLALQSSDKVLEIGPGMGFLTKLLCSEASSVTVVDLDRQSIGYLDSLKLANLDLKHGDILAFDIGSERFVPGKKFAPKNYSSQKVKIVGNLPYQITGLILGHLLGEIGHRSLWFDQIEQITLTVQKEVAERMMAKVGSKHYSQLSLLIQYHCQIERVLDLSPMSFFPPPKVNSTIVKLQPLKELGVICDNTNLLRRVIKAGFANRRKMLKNALLSLHFTEIQLKEIFEDLNIDPQARAENLSLKQFGNLANALNRISSKNENE